MTEDNAPYFLNKSAYPVKPKEPAVSDLDLILGYMRENWEKPQSDSADLRKFVDIGKMKQFINQLKANK